MPAAVEGDRLSAGLLTAAELKVLTRADFNPVREEAAGSGPEPAA